VTSWLLVTLMAPFASFGERAGNVERSTSERPTRSALIGLAGAALGIRREDSSGQAKLAASLRTATLTVDAGRLTTDFHTFQSLPAGRGSRPETRAEALRDRLAVATSITRREYRADVWYEAAYALAEGALITLAELEAAFRRPAFALFLGRRSCPLGAPLEPRIEDAADLVELFSRRHAARTAQNDRLGGAPRERRAPRTIAAESAADLGRTNVVPRRLRRVDDPGDRGTWQFSARDEYEIAWSGSGEERPE
jgi:CRISPR system Cascade subunit CasD